MYGFKMRYQNMGSHVHVTFFSKPTDNSTWVNNGTLVFTEKEWWDFRQQSRWEFEEAK
jgi:hypothetical protein